MAKPAGAEAPHRSLKSLYAFVREHLAVVNGLILASGSACAAIEALAPGMPLLTRAIRAATALLVVIVIVLALAPHLAGRSRRRADAEDLTASTDADTSRGAVREPPRQLLLWEEGGGALPCGSRASA
jgi:hypothetical protein